MLTGIHFLLTYECNYECDHCFLYCNPKSHGTFTIGQIKSVMEEVKKIGTVNSIFFEGGEPFLYYPLLLEGLRLAQRAGVKAGVVTNCYWATANEDAALWLKPILEADLSGLCFSNDAFHAENPENSPAKIATAAADELGGSAYSICIEAPTLKPPNTKKGEPVVGGGTLFKGRAADKLTKGLPTKPRSTFTECIHEELVAPKRVHVDSFGNVQVCQGISIGNMWKRPLSEIINSYDANTHPIFGPLVKGGPKLLAETYGLNIENECVDECHYCYEARRLLIEQLPEALAPRQVYGLQG